MRLSIVHVIFVGSVLLLIVLFVLCICLLTTLASTRTHTRTLTLPAKQYNKDGLYTSAHHKPIYNKIGFLVGSKNNYKEPLVMPLYATKAPYRQHRFNYHTMYDAHNPESSVALPIYHENKDCTNEVACTQLYSGDIISVHGHDGTFVIRMYK